MRWGRKAWGLGLIGLALAGCSRGTRFAQVEEARRNRRELTNGWSISPFGAEIPTRDLILNIVNTPDGRYGVALNSGYNPHGLTLFDMKTGKLVESVALDTSWYGLAWNPDGKTLYVSGGNLERGASAPLHVFAYNAEGTPKLTPVAAPVFRDESKAATGEADRGVNVLPLPENSATPVSGNDVFWSGLAHHPKKNVLFAANRTAGHIVVSDSTTGKLLTRIKTQVNPYDLVLSADAATLYVSNWASRCVSLVDTESYQVRGTIPVGENPNDMALARDGRLYVACANDNSVTIIDTQREKAIGVISTSMWERAPAGSTPNFVLLDKEEKTLYVANADNNNICVVAVGKEEEKDEKEGEKEEEEDEDEGPHVLGFIPTGEYPSAIGMSPDGRRLAVGSSKGHGSTSNLRGPKVGADGGRRVPASEGLEGSIKTGMKGTINIIDAPNSGAELRAMTSLAYENTPYHQDLVTRAQEPKAPSIIPREVGKGSAIKHVIYILKENRTYDQILGDIAKGNGDARIAIFGKDITPNHHALAEEYVLLDNYYVNAEVSVDGHSWSNAAYATDFNEKTWPADYGGRTGRPPFTAAARPPAGYLWDLCAQAGLTYRSYGEMVTVPSLQGHVAPKYGGWKPDLDIENADEFIRELEGYEKNFDSTDPEKRLPNFSIVCLPHDHTFGGRAGKPTVEASVAANDLALGMIVARVTRSPYWAQTAIFVTEDDAQDGSDHVDCHRSILLCISPYSRTGSVDSTHYTTSSMLRSIELLLGLPPMSQYDAAARPVYAAMGTKADLTPYETRPAKVDLTLKNKATAYGAKESEAMDLAEFDRAPMRELNEIVWKLVRGADSEMPLPVRRYDVGALYSGGKVDDDDFDEDDHPFRGKAEVR